ncbi:MAG: 3-dehydroquinate synthase [Clostridia bacterium]|nr:3-dehydroquinate synthase [Clostridia bacterium]
MKRITVSTQTKYDVIVGENLIHSCAQDVERVIGNNKICIISDENVWNIHGEKVKNQLSAMAKSVCVYTFAPGEDAKNIENLYNILEFLAENELKREDVVVTLGGGVTGDLGGFAASVYLRGIRLVHIPTSLLAMVDSSVGGKTAINLKKGKNLAGSFYQPSLVLCDLDLLKTLPEENYTEGMAEVIKYAVVFDENLFENLRTGGYITEEIIARCVDLKRIVVEEDERDTGSRMLLNFGHTLGHSVEKLSNYGISHGNGVAVGMAILTKGCQKLGICPGGTYEEMRKILELYKLPYDCDYTAEQLVNAAKNDKKSGNSGINLIIPQKIGSCKVEKMPYDKLLEIVKAGKE